MAEKLEYLGVIEHIVFHNDGNGYTVASFRVEGSPAAETITIVGSIPGAGNGRRYLLRGEMTYHPKYGDQFTVSSFEEQMPTGISGIESFLASGVIKGIGPKMAAAIVAKFGEDTLRVIGEEPERLLSVPGIGEKKAEAIAGGYRAQREFAEIALSLQEYGISSRQAMELYKTFGPETLSVVEENPYQLVGEIAGLGFKKADAIAARMGIAADDPNRIMAGIRYGLGWYIGEGHTFAPRAELVERTAQMLDLTREQVDEQLVYLAFAGDAKVEDLQGQAVVYPMALYAAERYVAFKLLDLADASVKPILGEPSSVVAMAQRDLAITFSSEQYEAVLACLEHSVCAITGGPGTGKTTIINGILRIFRDNGLSVAIAAPTGRAAKRITQTTGAPASTIHRLLEYHYDEEIDDMSFGKDDTEPLEYDAVIVDEASMIDILLMQGLLKAMRPGTRLVIVGDADQLPSVGAGNVLRDILDSEAIHAVALKDIYRQAAESLIVVNAHRINRGDYPSVNEKDGDFWFMQRDHEPEMLDTILDLCVNRLPAGYDMTEGQQTIQVISPTRMGTLGTNNLNTQLQAVLNPPSDERAEKTFGDKLFREGDKVMQIRNNYDLKWKTRSMEEGEGVFNGDVGIISRIDEDEAQMTVIFDDDRFVHYDFANLDELELAYAVTVHKAQGSEFPIVVMPMTWFPPVLATRNLIYTAITRAKSLVVLVGSPGRMNAMVDNDYIARRNSGLALRLMEALQPPEL